MQNYTLGDILAEALAEKPRNEPLLCDVRYTVHVWADLVKYPNKKITMIKFLRDATGITLKDAKNTVESTEGFLIPRVIWNAMSNNISFSGEPLELFTEKDPYARKCNPVRIFC